MNPEVVRGLLDITLEGLVKWMAVGALVMYIVFALVVVKQVGIMTEAIESELNTAMKWLSWAHLVGAAMLLLLGIYIL